MSVSRTLAILAILAVILGAWFFATSAASLAAGAAPPEQLPGSSEPVELLKSDASSITFAVELSGLALEQDTVNGVVYDTLSVPGFGMSSKIGSPQVPTKRVLLGIPLGAEYHLHVSADQPEAAPGQYRLLPAPTPIFEPASELDPRLDLQVSARGATGWDYVEDEYVYSTDALYPDAIAEVVSSGFIRDQRFLAVQVNPVQYNPVTGELVLHKQITVVIDFTYPHGPELGMGRFDPSFEPVLRAGLLNYESAAHWRGKSTSPVPTVNLAAEIRDTVSPALKIMVNEDGIYQVTATDLEALDVPVSELPTTTYKLFYRDREVPIRVLESVTETLESLWFYGEQARTKYTDTNVYWLTYDPATGPGLRMQLRDAAPVPTTTVAISPYYSATVRLEEDHWYRSYMPWAGNLDIDPWDHWFWNYTLYPLTDPEQPPNLAFPVELNDLDTAPYSATLRASLTGWSAETKPDYGHCVEFYVNDQEVGSHAWYGKYREQLVSFVFSGSDLREGTNSVEVRGCESDAYSDIVFYDWFELDFRRLYQAQDDWLTFGVAEADWQYRLDGFVSDSVEVFDVSGTYTVTQLAGFHVSETEAPYSVSFYDETAEQGTRYLALTHDRLKSPVATVKDTPSDLANTANRADYIIIAPQEFIADIQPLADHRANQGLDVIVADLESIFDEFNHGIYSPEAIRNFLDYAYHNWSGDAPAYVLLVGDGTYDYKNNLDGNPNLLPPYLAWVDPTFGEEAADNRYVTVNGDDPLPDMHIGRFPAETSAHVQAMVDKTIAYETNPEPLDWALRVLFVADDPDLAGDFHSLSDDLVDNYLPDPYVPVKVYYGDTCLTGAECKQVILDTLDTGALLVNYVGHGSLTRWTDNGVWAITDLASLNATTGLPVMLSMTCFDGAFHQDQREFFAGTVLAEATVRLAADRGAVASWAASGAGVASGHDYLNKGFLQAALFDGVRQLGAAADAGKARVFATGDYTDLIETYHLFGDPALRMNSIDVVDVAVGQSVVWSAHENKIEITLSFTNTGPDLAVGVALTDVIPTELLDPTVVFTSPEVLASREGITFAWTIADLLPGASGGVVLEAYADPEQVDEGFSFFNVAQIGVETHDLVPGNNVSRAGLNLKSVYLPLVLRSR